MGLFNIGASGQYTVGMLFALYAGFTLELTTWNSLDSLCISRNARWNAMGNDSLGFLKRYLMLMR